jgi:hypothetical protein
MLVKGIFLGIAAAVVSIVFFLRWLSSHSPMPGATMAVDIRVIEGFLLTFFGGASIGVGVVAVALFAMHYALRSYALHNLVK